MNVLGVRLQSSVVVATLKLGRFICDWPSSQQKFISGITDQFHGWHQITAENFVLEPSLVLQDLRCKCQLFEGACNLVLTPETLRVECKNVGPQHQSVVRETILRASKWFRSALGDHALDMVSFHESAHLKAMGATAVDAYIAQLMVPEIEKLIKAESNIDHFPSSNTVLLNKQEEWSVRRIVEVSNLIENGIYVSTNVEIRSAGLMGIADRLKLFDRASRLADRVVGLNREEV